MKNLKNIVFVLVVAVFVLWMMMQDAKRDKTTDKPVISLSTFSLYDIAKHIAGESAELVMILPFGKDPHSFEPTPKLMAKIFKSDLVVYSGAGLEPWIDGFDFGGRVVDMSKRVRLRKLNPNEHHNHHHLKNAHYDPHYWLDIQNMILATNVIADELVKISPANKDMYLKNKNKYIASLKKLDEDFKKELRTCQNDTIIVNHNAFSYMAHNYNFHVKSLSGFSPQAQPSAKKMIELANLVKKYNLNVVFFESFANDKAIKSIASETGSQVEMLEPLGNITADEAKRNLDFEGIMRENLQKLSKAMKCQ